MADFDSDLYGNGVHADMKVISALKWQAGSRG